MIRVMLCIVFCLMSILCPRAPAFAEMILNDDFNNKNKIDVSNTTAYVEPDKSWVRLPKQAVPNALTLKQFGPGYVVVTTEGIKIMEYDEAGDRVVASHTIEVYDGLGVSIRQDIPRIWVLQDDRLTEYDFDDNAQAYAPGPAVTGLGEVVSISSVSSEDNVIVLSKTGSGTGFINFIQKDDSGVLNTIPDLSFDTLRGDPVAVSFIPNSPDFVYAGSTELVYYAYDDANGNYQMDPARSITGIKGVISVSSDGKGLRLLTETDTCYYIQSEPDGFDKITAFSQEPIEASMAISANPESYDYARLTADGTVKYFSYDESTGTDAEIPQLSSTGHVLLNRYLSPRNYQSICITKNRNYDTVRLTVNEQNDNNTLITYMVSSDGGQTWHDINPGLWKSIPEGKQFIIKAVLKTEGAQDTPRLLNVLLEGAKLNISGLSVTAIALPPAGQTVPTGIFPVYVKAGAQLMFTVETAGYAEQVAAVITGSTGSKTINMMPEEPINSEDNTWLGSYVVLPGTPEGTIYEITLTAVSGINQETASLSVNPFIIVRGSVLKDLNLMLVQ